MQSVRSLFAIRLNSLRLALTTLPSRQSLALAAGLLLAHLALCAAIGFGTGFFTFRLARLSGAIVAILPLTTLVFPSLMEELMFRGLLIPHPSEQPSRRAVALAIALGTLLFVLWHPLNAYLFNHTAQVMFSDLRFLSMAAVLGIACGIAYARSGSLWVPVAMHWVTVLLWILLLGGRNVVAGIVPG